MNPMYSKTNISTSSYWKFHNPVDITFGRGCRTALVEKHTDKVIIIVTTKRGRCQLSDDYILKELIQNNEVIWVEDISENPGLDQLQDNIDMLVGTKFDAIVAFGGGSSIDAAKVLNVGLASNIYTRQLKELLMDSSLHKTAKTKELFTVPTTSGTGSEVTPFATVWDRSNKKKLSLAGHSVWPSCAIVDSALTDSVPIDITISTGLDAINQAAESLWNRNANPITIDLSIRSIKLGYNALLQLVADGANSIARDHMAEASLLAGLAISQTRTSLCHSISYPITAHFGVPHGLACAFTMPIVLKHNLQADDGRFMQLAETLTGSQSYNCLISYFENLNEKLKVRDRVKKKVPSIQSLLELESEMFTVGRADNNLFTVQSVANILKDSWSN